MYQVRWDPENNGIVLVSALQEGDPLEVNNTELRPVFHEELDLLDFHWEYPRGADPLLWAVGREYYYRGELVAKAKGGSFYEKPVIEYLVEDLRLVPCDLEEMSRRNAGLLDALAQRAIEFIRAEYEQRRASTDVVSVAFSGGKDSVVVLDLVQRALPPDAFVVVFGDTTMEISATYEVVDEAKAFWPQLKFLTARSHIPASESWKLFGPPSRFQRWCCSVHKSAPSLLLLKEFAQSPALRSLVYEGVRAGESQVRSTYDPVAAGVKHSSQINARPLLHWSGAEIYLYVLARGLPLHAGYRAGLTRVGCAVCPFGSGWSEAIAALAWPEDIRCFLELLAAQAPDGHSADSARTYIGHGVWKRRAGGRTLDSINLKVLDRQTTDTLELTMLHPTESWREWLKAVGAFSLHGPTAGSLRVGEQNLPLRVRTADGSVTLLFNGMRASDKEVISCLRSVANKAAYCVHCRACEADCPTGALSITDDVQIDERTCVRCHRCLLAIEKGCLVAKSLQVGKGTGVTKGLDRYCTFGLRDSWLEQYLRSPEDWWGSAPIGPRQLVGMRAWLADAEIIDGGRLTLFGRAIQRAGSSASVSWAMIWTNLARNSAVVNWFVSHARRGVTLTKDDLVDLAGDGLARRTRQNAIASLVQLLANSPLGHGVGVVDLSSEGRAVTVTRTVAAQVPQLALLYSLYRLGEELGSANLTLGDVERSSSEGPIAQFCLPADELKRQLQGLASQYPELLHVEFSRGLDNIMLSETASSLDVLDYV